MKTRGDKILNNYKKQLAERRAREFVEEGGMLSPASMSGRSSAKKKTQRSGMGATASSLKTSKSNRTKDNEAEFQKIVQQMMHKISTFETPEPPGEEVIYNILKKKTNFD